MDGLSENKIIKISNEDIVSVDTSIFFDVKEAIKRTKSTRKKIIENSMLKVYSSINEAISNGQDNVVMKLHENQITFLKAKGFDVDYYSNGNYKIKWETTFNDEDCR